MVSRKSPVTRPALRLYRTAAGLVVESAPGAFFRLPGRLDLDAVFAAPDPEQTVRAALRSAERLARAPRPVAPIQSQEVWAAGVTYQRSRVARMSESQPAGGGSFYDRVYEAKRPELFFKATPHRVAAPGEPVRIRRDASWNVPEPELTLAINAEGRIFGYTVGNDMSSRDIEAENPLYLPQAKVYDASAALGPCLLLTRTPLPAETEIALEIRRRGRPAFSGKTSLARIKRPLPSLAEYLFRESTFPTGCFLMTGTGIVPPDDFTLRPGDEIRIAIEPIGTLVNPVVRGR